MLINICVFFAVIYAIILYSFKQISLMQVKSLKKTSKIVISNF